MFDTWHEILLMVITSMTLIIQLYVAYLIHFHTPKNMKNYKYFLTMLLLCDVIFTCMVGFLLQPYPLPYLAIQGRGFCSYFSEKICVMSGAGTIAFGGLVIMVQIYCLLYRCLVLLPNKLLYNFFFSIPMKLLALFAFFCLGFAMGYFFFVANYRRDEYYLHPHVGVQLETLRKMLKPGDAVLFINLYDSVTIRYLWALISLTVLAESISFVFVGGILVYLRKHATSFSKVTYKLHMQFTILLAVQLITPMILLVFPIGIFVRSLIAHKQLDEATIAFGFIDLAIYGLINGALTLFFVGPYRKCAKRQLVEPFMRVLGFWKRVYIVPINDRNSSTVQSVGMSSGSRVMI